MAKNQISGRDWMQVIQECRTSGLSDRAWCLENGIPISSFYYQIRRLRHLACDIPQRDNSISAVEHHDVVKVQIAEDTEVVGPVHKQEPASSDIPSCVSIRYNGAVLEISEHANTSAIMAALQAVKEIC